MRILVINQYYVPDWASSGQLLGSLCEGLAEQGIQVDVICGFPSYTENAPTAPVHEQKLNLTIRRVSTGGVRGRSGKKRVLGYIGFFFFGFIEAMKNLRKKEYDIMLTLTNPPFVGILGILVKRLKRTKFVYVIHDIHPDILMRTGRLKKGVITGILDFINIRIIRSADKIVVLGPKMAEYLSKNKGVAATKLKVIHNWSVNKIKLLPKDNEFRQNYKFGNSLVILYAGNMGISHNLEWLIESAHELLDNNIIFVFVGDGEKRYILQKKVQQMRLENVLFLPYQDGALLNKMLSAADICVVALEPELAGLAVPSKIYPIMAAGRPILAITSKDSDVAEIVRQWECGWIAQSSGNITEIIKNFIRHPEKLVQSGQRARIAYEKAYSKNNALKSYIELFEES